MSNLVSALMGARFEGGIATVSEAGLQGMITLRGDLSAKAVQKAATSVTSCAFPEANTASFAGACGIAWMSTDELLILCPHEDVAANLAKMHKALGKAHALAVDVSDARAVFDVSGPNARDVLAKLVPVDLSVDGFTAGMFRRTRMAQIPAAFWLHDAETLRIVTFRSNAKYVFDLLKAAAQAGSEVLHNV